MFSYFLCLHLCVYLYFYLYDRRGMQPCQRCLTSFKYLVVFKKGVTRVKIFPTCNCKFNASIRDYFKKRKKWRDCSTVFRASQSWPSFVWQLSKSHLSYLKQRLIKPNIVAFAVVTFNTGIYGWPSLSINHRLHYNWRDPSNSTNIITMQGRGCQRECIFMQTFWCADFWNEERY